MKKRRKSEFCGISGLPTPDPPPRVKFFFFFQNRLKRVEKFFGGQKFWRDFVKEGGGILLETGEPLVLMTVQKTTQSGKMRPVIVTHPHMLHN